VRLECYACMHMRLDGWRMDGLMDGRMDGETHVNVRMAFMCKARNAGMKRMSMYVRM
jgi:hypothetical protein